MSRGEKCSLWVPALCLSRAASSATTGEMIFFMPSHSMRLCEGNFAINQFEAEEQALP